MQNSMQDPEILLCFSGPVGLLLVQIPFPAIPVSWLPILPAHHGLISSWCLSWGGFSSVQGPCPGVVAIPGAISSVMWHLSWAAGRLQELGLVLPVASRSWAVNLHYIDRGFLGGSRGAGAGMDIPLHPSLHPIPAAPHPARPHRAPTFQSCATSTSHSVTSAPSPVPRGPALPSTSRGCRCPTPVPPPEHRAAGFSLSTLHCP